MQRTSLLVGEVITFIVSHQVNERSFGESRRLIKNKPTFLHARSESTHVPTVRVPNRPIKYSVDCVR